jgi:hypothetical protein
MCAGRLKVSEVDFEFLTLPNGADWSLRFKMEFGTTCGTVRFLAHCCGIPASTNRRKHVKFTPFEAEHSWKEIAQTLFGMEQRLIHYAIYVSIGTVYSPPVRFGHFP